MIAVLCVLGWLAIGFAVVMLGIWIDAWVYDPDNEGDTVAAFLSVLIWPLALVFAVGAAAFRTTVNAKARRTTIREEMEREARKAAKEVEDFLRSAR